MGRQGSATRYGAGARLLHWLTVVLLVAQFTIGYLLDDDVESVSALGGVDLRTVHIALGVTILVLLATWTERLLLKARSRNGLELPCAEMRGWWAR